MLIDNLTIQCFRGISDSISLDFSAPLTVLYAPNGTGKTSICDAVEWVLCGSVGRLDKDESIRCKLGDSGVETLVEASVLHQDSPFFIKRVLSGSDAPLYRKDNASDYRVTSEQELLRCFVTSLPPNGNSNRAKVDWVRSTRFLESDSLSLLIDNDKESNDRRKLIFSNLFGVAEYQNNERDLNRILGKLPSEKKIKTEKEKINKKISGYEELIKKLIAEQSAPYRDHALSLLNTIAEYLNERKNTVQEADAQEYHKLLELKYIQNNQALDEQKSSLLYVRENITSYRDDVSKADMLKNCIKVNNEKLTALNNDLTYKKQELEERRKKFNLREELICELSEVISDIKSEKLIWKQLYEQYRAPDLEPRSPKTRVDQFIDYIAAGEGRVFSLKERNTEVDKCIKLLPAYLNRHGQLNGINIELEALQARQPIRDAQRPLAEQVSEVKAQLDTLQASREKTLGELELLLSSGKRYVETHGQDSECPLCEYKYDSNQALREKIDMRLSKLSNKSKEEAVLTLRHDDLSQRLLQENSYLRKIEKLVGQKNHLSREIQETEDRFLLAGITRDELSQTVTLSNRLESIRKQNNNTINEITQSIEPYKRAYDSAKKLDEMLIKIRALSSSWLRKFELHHADNITIDSLGDAFSTLESLLEEQSALSKKRHEDEKPLIKKIADDLSKLGNEKNTKLLDVSTAKSELALISNSIEDFKRKWATISSEKDINEFEIEKAAAAISAKARILNEIKSLFAKVSEYFVKIRESEKKESEYGLYKKELAEAQEELTEWHNQENARYVIEKEVNLIKEEIRRFIAQEISPLSNIINTLYLRAQGNRFINSIEARASKDGLLEWIAELDEEGESFDKMRSLSQGQRQDLALAIFLARARSLGGTFFLDEPLAHLDDLNRVALLDTLRIIVSEKRSANPLVNGH